MVLAGHLAGLAPAQAKDSSPTPSDIALREGLTSPCPPRSPGLSRRESFGRRDSSSVAPSTLDMASYKYDQFGSLGRRESLGRKRFTPSNSSGVVGLDSRISGLPQGQVHDPCPDMRRISGQLEVLHITSTPNHSTTLQNTSRSLKTTTSPTCLYSRSRVCNRFSTTAPHLSRRLRHHLTLDEVRLGCRQTHEMESVTLTG